MDRDNTFEDVSPDLLSDIEAIRANLIEMEKLTVKAIKLRIEFLELWNMVIASYLGMVLKGYQINPKTLDTKS